MSRPLGDIGGALLVLAALASVGAAAEIEFGPAYVLNRCSGVLGSWASGPALVVGMVGPSSGMVRPELRLSWCAAAFDQYAGFEPPHAAAVAYSEYLGGTAEFWRGSMGFRFVGAPGRGPYFALRTGILAARLGAVERHWWDTTDPDRAGISRAAGTGVTVTEGYLAVGMGAVVWQSGTRGLALEAEAFSLPNVGGLLVQAGAFTRF